MVELSEATANLADFLESYGLIAFFAVMLLKEVGIPLPIPSDWIMLLAAAQSAAGEVELWQAFAAIMVAMFVGDWLQYLLARGFGRPFLYRFGRYGGLSPSRLDRAVDAVRRGGAVGVGISLMAPGVRITTIPACGLARLPYRVFLPGLLAGNTVFVALHFVLGYFGGPMLSAAIDAINLPMLGLIAVLLVIALGGWLTMHRRTTVQEHGRVVAALESLRHWAEASCPSCMVVAAALHIQSQRNQRTVDRRLNE